MNEAIRMQLSAFVDGELPDNEAELLVRRLSQDAELRQQFAEYQAIGRLMRGEMPMPGIERLRERIVAELDERPLQDLAESGAALPRNRFIRPVAGFAIAAGVAMVAILGLRQTVLLEPEATPGPAVAETGYTVPQADELMKQYFLMHGATSSDLGGNSSINTRLVTLRLREDVLVDEDGALRIEPEAAGQAPDTDPASGQ